MQATDRSRPTVWPIGSSVYGLLVTTILGLNFGCGTSRISGTYIAHGVDFAQMLQLTETNNGQVTGVFSSVGINPQGQINPNHASVTGAVDNGQLTLSVHAFLFGENVAGTARGNTIQLQGLESNGSVQTVVLKRGSQSDFKKYADEIQRNGRLIFLARNLGRGSQELRQTVQKAERWISFAELHAQRITGVKDYYRKLEGEMQSLVASERGTFNAVAKAQMKAAATQKNVAGQQTDIQVNQMWDRTIGDSGRNLSRTFAGLPSNCYSSELRKYGATGESLGAWQSACQQAQVERKRFEPIFKRIIEQRAELKTFQVASEAHRQALVNEAWQIQ